MINELISVFEDIARFFLIKIFKVKFLQIVNWLDIFYNSKLDYNLYGRGLLASTGIHLLLILQGTMIARYGTMLVPGWQCINYFVF